MKTLLKVILMLNVITIINTLKLIGRTREMLLKQIPTVVHDYYKKKFYAQHVQQQILIQFLKVAKHFILKHF